MENVMTDRTAARVIGALFIMATVSFSLSVGILEPVIGDPDVLSRASASEMRVRVGILLEIVNHIAVVGIAMVAYPVLKRFNERLAVGYVAARSIEAVLFAIGTMKLLTLLVVSREFMASSFPDSTDFQTWAAVLLAGHDLNNAALPFIAFGLGALILNFALYRTRLVPRWLSVCGLLAAASILTARMALLLGVNLSVEAVTMMDAPIFVQEMLFAIWLIVRGFNMPPMTPPVSGKGLDGERQK